MTKGEIIGQVLLRLSGGRPTTDMSTRYSDVEVLIAPVVNMLYTEQYYLEKSQEDGNKDVNPLMLQVYDSIKVEFDQRRDRKYAKLPAKPITLPSGRSIDYVGPLQGKGFVPMTTQDLDVEEYFACFKKDVTSFLIEGSEITFKNLPPLVKEIMVKMIVSAQGLKDTDEVIVPTGTEPKMLQLLFELLTGQKELKNDDINDGQDHTK